MSTTMNFTLSPTLLGNLTSGGSGNGVYAYAFAFEAVSYTHLTLPTNREV